MQKEVVTTSLSESEGQFLYNLEVLGMTQQRAAELAGVASPGYVLQRAEVAEARAQLRDAVRQRAEISKEDVVAGVKKAIDQADLLADPMAQIAGWREIAKMLGYDAPREVKVTFSMDANMRKRQIAQLEDKDLIEMLDAGDVIDTDFRVLDGH